MNFSTIAYSVMTGIFIYNLAKLRIGIIETYPYRNTLYIEPSKLNTQLKSDGSSGFSIGLYYFAYYKNKKITVCNNEIAKSQVYYLATSNTVNNLNKEFYYNKPNVY
jgi:hypothetical protein